VATGLQNTAGEDVSFGKTRSADPDGGRPGVCTVVCEYAQRALGPSTAALVKAAQARHIPWLRPSCSGGCSISTWSTARTAAAS